MFLAKLSRQRPVRISLSPPLSTRHLSSKLHEHYAFKPPPTLSPSPQNQSLNCNPSTNLKKQKKPPYRPPSSLDRTGLEPIRSKLPFDFRHSYTETNPNVRPIGLREPKYSPFGPGRLNREWTGVCAPAVSPKVKSVEGVEDPKLEERRKAMRESILGKPLTEAERKILVERCQRGKTKRQINLGMIRCQKFDLWFLKEKSIFFFWLSDWVFAFSCNLCETDF